MVIGACRTLSRADAFIRQDASHAQRLLGVYPLDAPTVFARILTDEQLAASKRTTPFRRLSLRPSIQQTLSFSTFFPYPKILIKFFVYLSVRKHA